MCITYVSYGTLYVYNICFLWDFICVYHTFLMGLYICITYVSYGTLYLYNICFLWDFIYV